MICRAHGCTTTKTITAIIVVRNWMNVCIGIVATSDHIEWINKCPSKDSGKCGRTHSFSQGRIIGTRTMMMVVIVGGGGCVALLVWVVLLWVLWVLVVLFLFQSMCHGPSLETFIGAMINGSSKHFRK